MAIPMKEGDEEVPASELQYEERFWRRRLDGIALDTVNKKCYLIEFKRTRDRRHSYEARAIEVARKQYESLMGGLRAIGEERGWEIEQLVFVGGTCGAVRVESFNKNSSYWRYQKAGGIVYDSEWQEDFWKRKTRC
jgi:hypothetical protein